MDTMLIVAAVSSNARSGPAKQGDRDGLLLHCRRSLQHLVAAGISVESLMEEHSRKTGGTHA